MTQTDTAATWSGVLHVFTALGRGGAELRTLDVVRFTGLRFAFLSVSGRAASLDDVIRKEGHVIHHLRVRGVKGIIKAARMMRSEGIRVVHSHLGVASGEVLMAAALARVPVRIAHFRSDAVGGRSSWSKSIYLATSRLAVRVLATELVGVSPSALIGSRMWHGRWRSRARVVPNGLEAGGMRLRAETARAAHPETADDRMVIAHIARAEPAKNRSRALRVWAELARRRTTTLKLIGAMTVEEMAEARAIAEDPATLATFSRVEFVGETHDVPGHLGIADVLLVTSMREGLPGVVLEALACGVPVVATDLPGIQWISSQTTGVTTLALSEDDRNWADALNAAETDRETIASAFAASPFLLRSAAQTHLDLWQLHAQAEFPSVLRFFSLVKMHRDARGNLRAHTPLMSNEEWEPFLRHFERIEILTRVAPGVGEMSGYVLDDERISVIEMPFYDGWKGYLLKFLTIRRFLRNAIEDGQYAYGVWAPSQIVPFVTQRVAKTRAPLLVRLIGDPEDVARAIVPKPFGAVLGAIARWSTEKAVRRASAVVYVTLRTLQRKYRAPDHVLTLARTNLKLADAVFALKRGGYEEFVEGGPARIIAVGSQQQNYKGHDLLIDAIALLRDEGHDVHLTLVGQGALHDSLKERANAARLEMTFIPRAGSTLDVAKLVAQHDIFVMPSRTEGMPKSLLEAMAVGTFALGSSVGGMVEVLDAEHRFAAGDLESLAERLRHYLIHRSEVEFGRNGQTLVFDDIWKNHSGPRVLDAFLADWTGRNRS